MTLLINAEAVVETPLQISLCNYLLGSNTTLEKSNLKLMYLQNNFDT